MFMNQRGSTPQNFPSRGAIAAVTPCSPGQIPLIRLRGAHNAFAGA
jgi:hypothetical protein